MRKQKWYCENCLAYGSVDYESDADVLSVAMAIKDAHTKTRTEPNCKGTQLRCGTGPSSLSAHRHFGGQS